MIPWPDDSWVNDIADDGALIGDAGINSGGPGRIGFNQRAYVWDANGQHGHPLSTPDGQHSSAFAVRGDWVSGLVADNVPPNTGKPSPTPSTGPAHLHTALWSLRTGELVVLPTTIGASAVSGNGLAITLRPGPKHAFAVSPTDSYTLDQPTATFNAFFNGVSDTGLIVGYGWDMGATDGPVGALTWQC